MAVRFERNPKTGLLEAIVDGKKKSPVFTIGDDILDTSLEEQKKIVEDGKLPELKDEKE